MVFGEIAIAASPKILCHFLGTRYIRLKERVKQSNKQYRARSLYSLKNYLYQKFRRKTLQLFWGAPYFNKTPATLRESNCAAHQAAPQSLARHDLLYLTNQKDRYR